MKGKLGSEWLLGDTEWVARAEEESFVENKFQYCKFSLHLVSYQATLVPFLISETKPCNVVTPQCSISLLLVSISITVK